MAAEKAHTFYWIQDDEHRQASGTFAFAGDLPTLLMYELVRNGEPELTALVAVAQLAPRAPLPDAVAEHIDDFINDGTDGALGSLFTPAAPFSGSNAHVAAMAAKVAEVGADLNDFASEASLTRDTLHIYGHGDWSLQFIVTRAASSEAAARQILLRMSADADARFSSWG